MMDRVLSGSVEEEARFNNSIEASLVLGQCSFSAKFVKKFTQTKKCAEFIYSLQ